MLVHIYLGLLTVCLSYIVYSITPVPLITALMGVAASVIGIYWEVLKTYRREGLMGLMPDSWREIVTKKRLVDLYNQLVSEGMERAIKILAAAFNSQPSEIELEDRQ